MKLTAIIEREGDGYVSLCPELDIASQGDGIEEARDNLSEALELFFEAASPEELKQRLHGDFFKHSLDNECKATMLKVQEPEDDFRVSLTIDS